MSALKQTPFLSYFLNPDLDLSVVINKYNERKKLKIAVPYYDNYREQEEKRLANVFQRTLTGQLTFICLSFSTSASFNLDVRANH